MVNKVTFIGFKGSDHPNGPPGSTPVLHLDLNVRSSDL